MYVKPFIRVVGWYLLQYLLKCALHIFHGDQNVNIIKEIQWKLTEKMLFQEI